MNIKEHNRLWYINTYNSLVMSRKSRGLDKKSIPFYTEKHHIIPECMDGDTIDDNLVLLTPREHIIAHMLLLKIFPDNLGIIRSTSAILMKNKGRNIKTDKLVSSRQIAAIRENYALHKDELAFAQVGRIVTDEARDKLRKHFTGKKLSISTKKKLEKTRWSVKIQGPDGTIYDSMKICAEQNNVSYQTIQYRLKNYPNDWRIIDSIRSSKSVKVQGPDGTIYDSIRDCARSVGRNHKTIKRWIENYPQLGYKYI